MSVAHATERPAVSAALRGARRHRELSVWLLVAGLAVAGAALAIGPAQALPRMTETEVPWWLLAILFAVAERCVVHLHFRRSAHSFSLGDIPLVVGLLFVTPGELLLAGMLGTAVVLVLDRQLPPIKLAFNLAQFLFTTSVAILLVHALATPGDILQPALWAGAVAAMMVTSALTAALITAAISLSEGLVPLRTFVQMVAMDAVVAGTDTCVALTAAIVASVDVRALPMLFVPVATVFLAYRAYISERQRHERLEFLYDATRTLSRSAEVAQALDGLLERSLETFRAELAEIVLVNADGASPLLTVVGPGERRETMVPVDRGLAADLNALVDERRPVVTVTPEEVGPQLQAHFEARGVTHAMIALLTGDERVIGTIMLGNRYGVVKTFERDDRKLFEALANNASVALQHDRLEQAVWRLEELQQQLRHRAFHDPLTDLANRSLFQTEVQKAVSAGGDHAVLFIDLDDFKTINDTLGHHAGDELLVTVAGRISSAVRADGLVARLGGDEFAVLLPGGADAEATGRGVAERILAAFTEPVSIGAQTVHVGFSIGVATASRSPGGTEDLLQSADVAMYAAKAKGKRRYAMFDPAMHHAVVERHGVKERLQHAVARNELRVQYQAIVRLSTGRPEAAEALVRWNDPSHGVVPPSTFVPLAEETGLIHEVGRFVLDRACEQFAAWRADEGGAPGRMHVNVSPVELRDPELPARVQAAASRAGIPLDCLVLEVTESMLMEDLAQGEAALHDLKDIGVRLALDDFGTGHSSLSYLRSLPFDCLKIAKPFVDELAGAPDSRDAAFVRLIIELARNLGLDVIAEGIECPTQVDALRRLGCEFGQGFHFGQPADALVPAPVLAAVAADEPRRTYVQNACAQGPDGADSSVGALVRPYSQIAQEHGGSS